jgi:antitoxin (DNA-binding transcriptional repressor) of toxin-antitoxin stability system
MTSVTIEEAQARLPELIDQLPPGGEVVITRRDQPVARLIGQEAASNQPRQPGSAKGLLTILVEDEEHLEDFKEYMS